MTPLEELRALANPDRAAGMAAYHKVGREYLGLSNPQTYELVGKWRAERDVAQRVELADTLWQTDIFEARVAAAKLLVQARMRPSDQGAWELIAGWVPEFDSWAIADHACSAGSRRLLANPERLDQLQDWATSEHMWSRRAALVMTLPWAKLNHLSDAQSTARERILGWAASYTQDPDWFIQKAVGWWIRDLSKHDAARAKNFLLDHGDELKPFARKVAAKYL